MPHFPSNAPWVALAKAIDRGDGYHPEQRLRWLVDDVLADFGIKKLETPPAEQFIWLRETASLYARNGYPLSSTDHDMLWSPCRGCRDTSGAVGTATEGVMLGLPVNAGALVKGSQARR